MKKFNEYLPLIVLIICVLIIVGGLVLPMIIGMSREMWLWALKGV